MEIRRTHHMRLMTLSIFSALAACSICPAMRAQEAKTDPNIRFDVASFKVTTDFDQPGRITRPNDAGYHGTNMSLMNYLTVAYQLPAGRISGPDEILNTHFDLEAKAEKRSTIDELHVMLQNLLTDRFHMKLRHEMKDLPGFALVVEPGGQKMTDHDPEDRVTAPIPAGGGKKMGSNVTMTYFAFFLSQELDKKVVDKTGLTGHYDFTLEYAVDRGNMQMMQTGAGPDGALVQQQVDFERASLPAGPTLPNALKQQLGLRLDPIKTPVEHLVIEHIEKLTEN
jgi:uncharacterized protein (TIGR03435 family)